MAELLHARRLIQIEQGRADEKERRKNEVGEDDGDLLRLVALRVQEHEQRVAADTVDEPECGDAADRMHEVGAAELQSAPERTSERQSLRNRRGDGQTEQTEPGDPGQHVYAE